jgi:hypothetical protein
MLAVRTAAHFDGVFMSRANRVKVWGSFLSLLPVLFFMVIVPLLDHPCFAQIDPSGKWAPIFNEDAVERTAGPDLGDYTGIPLNDAGRMRADTWDAALVELPENQCREHGAEYAYRAPSNLSIWTDVDPVTQKVIAYRVHLGAYSSEQTIWMDGRPQPGPYAPATWEGFGTGEWDGDTLVATFTHLKQTLLRLNGMTRSDLATGRVHFLRHGNYLTVVAFTYDPAYLSEPYIRSTDFLYNPQMALDPWPCEPVEEVNRPAGVVPMHLPDQNPFLEEFARKHQIPYEATRGYAEAMYPEYRKKLKAMKPLPPLPKKASSE